MPNHIQQRTNPSTSEIELLCTAYAAYNARDADAILALLTNDIALPRAFEGGFVRGHQAIRAYWAQQWSEINLHDEPVSFALEKGGQIVVDVHQVLRNLAGDVLIDKHVGHRFTLKNGLIQAMEMCPISLSDKPY